MNEEQRKSFRQRFREQGKVACRQGLGKDTNPYSREEEFDAWESWLEGWIYWDVHYPRGPVVQRPWEWL